MLLTIAYILLLLVAQSVVVYYAWNSGVVPIFDVGGLDYAGAFSLVLLLWVFVKTPPPMLVFMNAKKLSNQITRNEDEPPKDF